MMLCIVARAERQSAAHCPRPAGIAPPPRPSRRCSHQRIAWSTPDSRRAKPSGRGRSRPRPPEIARGRAAPLSRLRRRPLAGQLWVGPTAWPTNEAIVRRRVATPAPRVMRRAWWRLRAESPREPRGPAPRRTSPATTTCWAAISFRAHDGAMMIVRLGGVRSPDGRSSSSTSANTVGQHGFFGTSDDDPPC